MKEFITAVEEVIAEDENKEKVKARVAELVAEGMSEEEAQEKATQEIEGYVPFKVDGRECHAYQPTEGQLIFMLAALGRGQTQDQRFASIINIMLSSLRDEDAEYLESRLLERNPKKRLPAEKIEEIFEYLVEQWFGGKVTVPPSASAKSQPTDGPNSSPPTT